MKLFDNTLQTISLSDALSAVQEHLDTQDISLSLENTHDPEDPLDEVVLYAEVDAVMASLYKEYTSTKFRVDELNKAGQSHEPMADVAIDMLDSAWSAICTRLIELREDTTASSLVAKRLLVLEEQRKGNLSGNVSSKIADTAWQFAKEDDDEHDLRQNPVPAPDKNASFMALERREKREREQEESSNQEGFLVAFLLFYLAQYWDNKRKSEFNICSLNAHLKSSFLQAA